MDPELVSSVTVGESAAVLDPLVPDPESPKLVVGTLDSPAELDSEPDEVVPADPPVGGWLDVPLVSVCVPGPLRDPPPHATLPKRAQYTTSCSADVFTRCSSIRRAAYLQTAAFGGDDRSETLGHGDRPPPCARSDQPTSFARMLAHRRSARLEPLSHRVERLRMTLHRGNVPAVGNLDEVRVRQGLV
jgi:hypothetical protein